MKRTNNNIVSTYDNDIFPGFLAVGRLSDISILKSSYRECILCGDEDYELTPTEGGAFAETRSVLDCSRNRGSLVLLGDEIMEDEEPDLSIIAHEAVHVADMIYETIGESGGTFSSGNEPYAYIVQWATRNIFDYIKRIKKQDETK